LYFGIIFNKHTDTFSIKTNFINFSKCRNIYSSGFRIGFDLESRNQNFGVYLSANFNIAKYKNTTENLNKDMTAAIYEIDIGPRWYIGKTKKVQGNIDLGFSALIGIDYFQLFVMVYAGVRYNF